MVSLGQFNSAKLQNLVRDAIPRGKHMSVPFQTLTQTSQPFSFVYQGGTVQHARRFHWLKDLTGTIRTGYKFVLNGSSNHFTFPNTTIANYYKETNTNVVGPHIDLPADNATNFALNGYSIYAWVIPNEINSTAFINLAKQIANNLPHGRLLGLDRHSGPIFPNDHNWRTPFTNTRHKNKR